MAGSTLDHIIRSGVTLGSTNHPGLLTITVAGAIDAAAVGAVALIATLSAGYVLNQGAITAGAGCGDVSGSNCARSPSLGSSGRRLGTLDTGAGERRAGLIVRQRGRGKQ